MNEQTLQKMRQMKFFGMVRAFRTSIENGSMIQMTGDEMVSMLIDAEWDDRNNRRIERQMRNAKFRYKANIEQLHFDIDRNLDKNQFMRMAECTFIGRKENLLITGSTGIGKSFIASAIGNQACTLGFKVLYANTTKLFTRLKMAKADGSYIREVAKIERQDLLILDDFGLQPLDASNRSVLMEIVEDRHGNRSTIITSQLPVAQWYEVIGEQTIADAILDRIVHDAHRMELVGESIRRRQRNKIVETVESE
ncbi:mobile element protein [Aquipluma nitroreducens]|jgi:DNA replication protein DnaC|uniref:Mobile element protein n=2 Tax=Aquipluma nitroreducens TaxID=2010828 RepID=A0A5K7SAR0_9BACT|nr:mobile element protein [Aquipluma nitroreducens]BBE17978.1 mobile element protein [Aquipluma nitroreducens]BBE18011.1 mobile element protein [Aquipluma nitroreducens]BBE18546.1 mobile element protein [Aquipluma nitroreducens]BBE18836.1 mobile element protein [Aquipluma nitroreducens]